MRTPFKMSGHSLPGPNQSSPTKLVFTTAGLIAAGLTAATTAISVADKSAKKKEEEKRLAGEKKRKAALALEVGVKN